MQEMDIFYNLKELLLLKYQESYPYWQKSIHDFKGREISNFQELLEKEVGSRISEKWFYTHIKPKQNQRLPRIDTLDMLSAFLGYKNWHNFVFQQQNKVDPVSTSSTPRQPRAASTFSKKIVVLPIVLIGILMLLVAMLNANKGDYTFCFVDMDTEKPIKEPIEIIELKENESPISRTINSEGCCISFKQKKGLLTFVVNSTYYRRDTFRRILPQQKDKEIIKLQTDDYALMIHLFSTSNLGDWQKRRRQLDKMMEDNAVIFQVSNLNRGVAMYNKEEFIDKLTMPINSLKNIRILDTKYKKDKILELRFIQE